MSEDKNAEKLDKIQNDLNWIIRYLLARDQPYKYDPSAPWPTTYPKQSCPKCGISLDGVMGYVCGDTRCPTFMKVTC